MMTEAEARERAREIVHGYFGSWACFARVPKAAVFDSRLTDGEFRKLAGLCAFSDKHGVCFPSMGKIARLFGITRQAVQGGLRKPRELGYLVATRQTRPNGAHAPNLYQLNYPPMIAAEPPRGSNSESEPPPSAPEP